MKDVLLGYNFGYYSNYGKLLLKPVLPETAAQEATFGGEEKGFQVGIISVEHYVND